MKISIITINFNNAIGLQKTIASVMAQTCTDYEHIIVDGGSSDDSVKQIQDYDYQQRSATSSTKSAIRWTSEMDKGIYDAMNKGVRMSQGEYILMLNSGDALVDEQVLERIVPLLDGTDIVQGNTLEEHDGKTIQNRGCGHSDITMREIIDGMFVHQASFCRRDLFVRYGYFDESYEIVADKKFFMICLGLHDASFKYVDIDVANFDTNGISSATIGEWHEKHKEEKERMLDELFSPRLREYLNAQNNDMIDKLERHSTIMRVTRFLLRLVER